MFSIIIPHRGSGLGLWATIQACEESLRRSDHKYEYIVVSNAEPLNPETKETLGFLGKAGKLGSHQHYDESISPPVARSRGVACSSGEVLFFFDNHCIPAYQYFDRALLQMAKLDMDMLHSTTQFYTGGDYHYHYQLKLAYNFWASSAIFPVSEHKPYRIAAAGHGGFAVKRSVWDAVGGYGPESLLQGYGGEELLFDLKLGRMGFSNWIDPKLTHAHYAGNRGYSRHYTDEYYKNLMVSAFVIGGEEWLCKVFESFITKHHVRYNATCHWFDLFREAAVRGAQEAHKLDSNASFTLNELLAKYRREAVAM